MRKPGVLSALLLPVLVLASCSAGHHGTAKSTTSGDIASQHQSISVQSAVVSVGELSTRHIASGTVVPVTTSKVAARVAGIVQRVELQAGSHVKQNQVVVQLDVSQLKLAVDSAQAALETAKVNLQKAQGQLKLANLTLKRDHSLIKKELIPQSQVDVDSTNAEAANQSYRAAHAAVDQAQVQLKQAELNLHYASIRAPFAGQLAAVNVSAGEFVGQNTPVFILASPDRELDFKVAPQDATALSKGSPVSFVYQGQSYSAQVSEAPSTPIQGVVPIVANFRSATPVLPYGSVGSVSYRLNLAHAVIVPISSIQTDGNRNYVYAVVKNRATQRTVTVIAESGTSAAVSGIQPGSKVIVSPPPGLLAGSSVSTSQSGSSNG